MKNEKKKQIQSKVNQEIVESNRNAILINEQRRMKEKEEEEKIVQYNKEKAAKEAELIA